MNCTSSLTDRNYLNFAFLWKTILARGMRRKTEKYERLDGLIRRNQSPSFSLRSPFGQKKDRLSVLRIDHVFLVELDAPMSFRKKNY